MKKLLFALLVMIFIASCSVFNNNSKNSKYGTWKKVSTKKGNYVGKRNMSRGTAAFSAMHFMSTAAGDTTTADTSYINNPGQISMSISSNTWNNDYTIQLTFTDSATTFNWWNIKATYVTDSTALSFSPPEAGWISGRNYSNGVSVEHFWFLNNCKGVQAKNEYLLVNVFGSDSTKHKVFKIYVNGMKKIAQSLVKSCH